MNKKYWIIALLCILFFAGIISATFLAIKQNLDEVRDGNVGKAERLSLGMSRAELIKFLGEPIIPSRTSEDGRYETVSFDTPPLMSVTISAIIERSTGRLVAIQPREGLVRIMDGYDLRNIKWLSHYKVIEGKGIEHGFMLGDSIEKVFRLWGATNRVINDYSEKYHYLYSYKEKGIEVDTGKNDIITAIRLYCSVFNGETKEGLIISSTMSVNDIYKIYGEPESKIKNTETERIKESLKNNKPYIVDLEPYHTDINYPNLGIQFQIHNGLVWRCNITREE